MIRYLVGDALTRLRELPDESVHCCVTSPPYWGLRAYKGDPGMIGLEPTFGEHLANLVAVFREVRRVLREDGVCWLNYGDAYAANRSYQVTDNRHIGVGNESGATVPAGLKPKDLMLMPARVALALQADGWWVRSEIVWHKPNPMPESVRDRPTSAHEKVFLLTRSSRYFYDADAVRTPSEGWHGKAMPTHAPEHSERQQKRTPKDRDGRSARLGRPPGWRNDIGQPSGANLRNVLTIPTHAYSGAHFATFPPKLIEPFIKAGTSERGCCPECGAQWERVVERTFQREGVGREHISGSENGQGWEGTPRGRNEIETKGFRPTCDHTADPIPATVLDPFAGAGTTGLVADRLGRDAILIDISPDYIDMARERIRDSAPLFYEERVS